MRKKLSKIIALLFILATTLGGALPSSAAAPDAGNLHIHKYWVDDDNPHPNLANDGTKIDDGDITNPPVSGVGFDVYKIGGLELVDGTAATDVQKEQHAVPQGGDGWSYKKVGADKLEVSNGTSTYTYALGANENSTQKVTDATGTLTFSALPKGYYFVEENLGYGTPEVNGEEVEITSKVRPFVVAVPRTAADGETWMTDIHVYPKNEGMSPEKKPEVPSVNVGDDIKWSITANIPTDFSDYKVFRVVDELDEKLNFVAGSVEVYGIKSDGSIVETLTTPLEFGVIYTPANGSDKEKIVIELTPAGIEKLAKSSDSTKIRVDFKTKVNSKINEIEKNEVTNEAKIEFENTTNSDGETKTPPTKINTGEVSIKKTDQDGKDLPGAEFKLYYLENGDKYYIYKNSSDEIKGFKTGDTIPSEFTLYEAVSGSDGIALFSGLKTHKSFDAAGKPTDPMEYYIEETKAPDGYNLLQDPVKASFANENTNHVVLKDIVNKKGFTLPNTGGVGTILLVVVGIILIGLAIILTMNKKKKTA